MFYYVMNGTWVRLIVSGKSRSSTRVLPERVACNVRWVTVIAPIDCQSEATKCRWIDQNGCGDQIGDVRSLSPGFVECESRSRLHGQKEPDEPGGTRLLMPLAIARLRLMRSSLDSRTAAETRIIRQ